MPSTTSSTGSTRLPPKYDSTGVRQHDTALPPPVPGVSAVSPVYAQVEVRYNVPYGARRAINPLYIAATNAIAIPPS